jgi:hypothetical protein
LFPEYVKEGGAEGLKWRSAGILPGCLTICRQESNHHLKFVAKATKFVFR